MPPGEPGDMADDAGHTQLILHFSEASLIPGGVAMLDTADPLSPPQASPSVQGHFTHAAVSVDSKPCSRIGK